MGVGPDGSKEGNEGSINCLGGPMVGLIREVGGGLWVKLKDRLD